ncbi:axonemal dynein light chain domain-containing protein 1 [Odontesthes bonariensis]|uniref:axonemal dynein light chain domain-containing protein 1 n=1 Tax=Odontesthes bonariensis TaxID=219752 RepID=UPI003F584C03
MSASSRANSAPSFSRPKRASNTTVAKLNIQVPAETRKKQPLPVKHIPHELLVSLTSTVCNRSTQGHASHCRHCEGCGIRRPDAVWHHPLGRKKYKYFLEQPTSLTGAGRDISFLCDAAVNQRKTTPLPPMSEKNDVGKTQNLSVSENVIPEEYHIVKNKGIRCLEFYEDAFTVQLKDEEQKLRVLPSLKPSGRLEVVQLMSMMDDMLEKAGVDQQREELTELSQLEGLLDLVKIEQNIYNIVFHELIRQVTVGCAERGQLLAKLRQRYQSLLDRIPRRLKALHTEAVAQRALDRRLTEEINRIKTSIQQLSTELSKIRAHDALVSQQAQHAHQQLAEALRQTHSNSDVVRGYHELYELHRSRLEAQLLHMTEDRDCWSQFTLSLALKVISMKRLQVVSRLYVSEQGWFNTAEHCLLYLSTKDTEDLNGIVECSGCWKEQLVTFISELKTIEHAQCEQIRATQQGITRWFSFLATQNECLDPKYDKASVEEIHTDLKQWSDMLALQCDHYQGEKQLMFQQKLGKLHIAQDKWLNISLQLIERHPSPHVEGLEGQQALRELDRIFSELLKQLDTQVSGESGTHRLIMSLVALMEPWVSKTAAVIGRPEMMPASDWLKLEEELYEWRILTEETVQHFSSMQTENKVDTNKLDMYTETERLLEDVQEFKTSLSNVIEGENQRLREEVSSVHMALTRWMLDLLLVMVPDHSEEQFQEQEHHNTMNTSLKTLDEVASMLTEKLDFFSSYITRSCNLILEERALLDAHKYESENKLNEFRKLQDHCADWVETSKILLAGVGGDPVELLIEQPALTSSSTGPADSMDTQVCKEASAELTTDNINEIKDETEAAPQEGELTVCKSPVVKLISSDGHIIQKNLGESTVHLTGTDEPVVSPATEEAQKAFSDLNTQGLLLRELHDSEVRVQSAEQRALTAEEALQAALEQIQDLERQLHGQPSLELKTDDERKKTPPPSPPTATTSAPTKKTATEAKPASSTKKTKKR